MSPSEFAIRITAADERFEHARKCDDILEMRAALSEKTELLKSYYAVLKNRARNDRPKYEIDRRP